MPRTGQPRCLGILVCWVALACGSIAWAQPGDESVDSGDASPLLHEPKTPEEMFSAVLLMVDLARIDLAYRYLGQFIAANPDDAMLIRLRQQHGTGEFVKLSRIKALTSRAQPLLDRLTAISQAQAEDPNYARVLIEKLTSSPVQRELAIREFRNLGEAAIPHLLRQLAKPVSALQTDQLILAITRIGQPGVAPTIAGLESPSLSVRLGAISALGLLKSPGAVPYLWHPAFHSAGETEVQTAARQALVRILTSNNRQAARPSEHMAGVELQRIARQLFYRQMEPPVTEEGEVVLWNWSDEAGTVVRNALTPDQAQHYLATHFARQAFDLLPENTETQRLYLSSQLGWTVAEQGRDQLLDLNPGTPGYVALTAGEQTVTDVLAESLAAGQAGAAQAALQILGQIGSHHMIFGGAGRKSPVLSALNYPDLRIQFAAANTILRLEPKKSFRGADRIVSILTRAVTNTEERKALIVDADTERAEVTAGYLTDLGYSPVLARTGKEAFQQAAHTAGIELAVIHINCIQWDLSQTVANLRADARTAYLPLVLYGPEDVTDVASKHGRKNALAFPEAASSIWKGTLPPGGRLDPIENTSRLRVGRLILRNGPATFVAESGSPSDFVDQVRPFANSIAGAQMSGEERGQYQELAARWLSHLSQMEKGDIYDLASAERPLVELTEHPQLADHAIVALSGIASDTAQLRLQALAINPQFDPAIRLRAANQLSFHMQRYGVLLTSDQVRELHAAWSKEKNIELSTALAGVIGSLHPEAKTIGKRISKLSAPR